MGVTRQNRPEHRKSKVGGFFCTLQNNEGFCSSESSGKGGGGVTGQLCRNLLGGGVGRGDGTVASTLALCVCVWGGGGGAGQLRQHLLFGGGGGGGRTVASTLALWGGGGGGQDSCVDT